MRRIPGLLKLIFVMLGVIIIGQAYTLSTPVVNNSDCGICHGIKKNRSTTQTVTAPQKSFHVVKRPSRADRPYMLLEVTAYSYTGSRTASGTWPKRGTVAAEWRYFPPGTRLFIQGYGYGTVEDTGGVIRGDKPIPHDGKANLDVFMTSEAAKKWGRRVVKVWKVDE